MVEDNYIVLMMYKIEPSYTFITIYEHKLTHSYYPKSSLPFTLEFPFGILPYMDLDKCIIIAVHHCSIIECFTGLKTLSALPVHLYIPSNPSQQLGVIN